MGERGARHNTDEQHGTPDMPGSYGPNIEALTNRVRSHKVTDQDEGGRPIKEPSPGVALDFN